MRSTAHDRPRQAESASSTSCGVGPTEPVTLFIACLDADVEPAALTGTNTQDLVELRTVGCRVPWFTGRTTGESATIDYAVGQRGVRHVVILGHVPCAALEVWSSNTRTQGLLAERRGRDRHGQVLLRRGGSQAHDTVGERAKTPRHTIRHPPPRPRDAERGPDDWVERSAQSHLLAQLHAVQSYPVVQRAVAGRGLELHAWLHGPSGSVTCADRTTMTFGPL